MRHALALALVLSACKSPPTTTTTTPPPTGDGSDVAQPGDPTPPAPTKPVATMSLASIGLDPASLDKTADPCGDFYQFACGGWMKTTEIAADKPVAMRSFVAIEDRNTEWMKGVLEAARAKAEDAPTKQLSAFYGSCMDEATIEKAGLAPFKPLVATIDKVRDPKSLSLALAQLHAAGFNMLFLLGPTQDASDARVVIASIEQAGLGLPDRDYYTKDDDASKQLRAAYEAHVAAMLEQMGRKPAVAKSEAAAIVALETGLAKVSKDKVARRDPKGMYNKMSPADIAQRMPAFDWTTFWKTVGLAGVKDITVGSPDFLVGANALMSATKPDTWRAYLTFHLASKIAAYAPKKFEETQFKFAAALTGTQEMEPRWKRCAGQTDGALGDALGQVFVRDRFPGASKTAAEEQVAAIGTAMRANLSLLSWMDDATKVKANEKLKAMSFQIGYPKKWLTYDFKLDAKTWAANALAARRWERARQLAKIGKPVDKDDWYMSAPTVNAYYDPQQNGMVFPAGILQPPFYSVDASIPVNLGAMGVVVGHELTHGFDDQGAQYDAVGNLTNWWAPETEKQFKSRTQCVVDQYNQYDAGGGKVNGANTVGENIADIGGVKLALAAYRALRSSSPDTVVADGYTEDQQFFLGFGQAWCAKMRPDYEKLLVNVDVHSPARWRVNGTLQATPEFAKVWGCKAGAKMVPAKQCTVW